MDYKVLQARFRRWNSCSLCEQHYHGVVKCALGWACWKTYMGREKLDMRRYNSLTILGNGLRTAVPPSSPQHVNCCKEAIGIYQAQQAELEKLIQDPLFQNQSQQMQCSMVSIMGNIAACYSDLGRYDLDWEKKSLEMKRETHDKAEACNLPFENRLQLAINVANSLIALKHFTEAKSFLRQPLDTAVSLLDANHVLVLQLRVIFGQAQLHDAKTRGEVVEAEKVLADAYARQRRVCGPSHPDTRFAQTVLETARAALDAN